jgi:hypothetical protein
MTGLKWMRGSPFICHCNLVGPGLENGWVVGT